jgi:malate dehydrogenase (oxaloacetate-decarboxylating)
MFGLRGKILIIDDQPSEVNMIRMALEKKNYEVVYAFDGVEGIEKAKQERPDLIILDIMMPEKDGFQTADELRGDLDTCMIPIVILTGFSDPPSPLDDIEGPFVFHMWDEYLRKPVDPDVLIRHVERILALRLEGSHQILDYTKREALKLTPSASYSTIIRIELDRKPGMLGEVAKAIGSAGGMIGDITILKRTRHKTLRDITVDARDQEHERDIARVLNNVNGVKVIEVSDRTFFAHIGGKIEVTSKIPLHEAEELSIAYTPGVSRVCQAIQEDREKAYHLTIKRHTVAIVTDGTAVLGLGDIGPEAAMPVMEGKAMLFKEFGSVDAFPICLDTKDTEDIIKVITSISPGFGGINLEDISAPRCFEIENRLIDELAIPVFHDDQHGTAVVVLAALINALKVVGKRLEDLKVVVSGIGAAGVACTKMLMQAGASHFIGCDRQGTLYRGRTAHMNEAKEWYAAHTNPKQFQGTLQQALQGADLFIGLSSGHLLTGDDIKYMARDPIVFAMANPTPEIMPEEAQPYAKIIATGRSDYPNQINNVLCFPGLFKGALRCYARRITEGMKIAAARAIADVISEKEISEENIIPSVFNKKVAESVAWAVEQSAYEEKVARKHPDDESFYHLN